jgi:hypothetical protein
MHMIHGAARSTTQYKYLEAEKTVVIHRVGGAVGYPGLRTGLEVLS